MQEDGRNVEKREAAIRMGKKRLRDLKGDWTNLVKEGTISAEGEKKGGRSTELFRITLLKRNRTGKLSTKPKQISTESSF